MRKLIVLLLLSVAAIGWLLDVAAQTPTTARLVITLPADAKLYFGGAPTEQTGTKRTFSTPALQPGKSYVYDLKAEVTRQGKVFSQVQQPTVMAGQTTQVDFSSLGTETATAPAPQGVGDAGWPRKITSDGNSVTIYQPQVEKWEGNRIEARAVATIETKASPEPIFGVIWIAGRTDVDKENRLVHLNDVHITKVNFPSKPDKANDYLTLFRGLVPQGTRTLSLDRLQANMAVNQAETQAPPQPLKNDVPRIIVSTKPALLVLIDGKPALRNVDNCTNCLRVINTRSLILLDQDSGKNYLHLMNRWMEAADLEGTWTVSAKPPAFLAKVLAKAKDNPQIDLMDDVADDLAEDFQNGIIPTIYVSTVPTELVDTRGEPDFAPIEGTKLLWVRNTSDEIIMDSADNSYYVLLSGRWFRSMALKGPWEFVAASKLPADFAKIPQTHPKGDVLSSVAGTPQAQEALIANRVPQTASISRSEAKLSVLYDGQPKFEPIDGTQLQYAVNSPTPVVQTGPTAYYAVENGVWFTAAAPTGPWAAATSVPPAIYAMPPSSPIYYVTNVQVYGSTPEVVYTGYTPGYFGTCYDPDGVIVYGTGWNFNPWLGAYWFGRPWTYGFNAHFGLTSSGWGFGYGCGWGRPWWGPAGWNAAWGGNAWRPGWNNGMGGRYANTHINNVNFNNFNAYNRWGNNVHVHQGNTNIVAPRNTQVNSLNRGFNNTIATKQGDVLKRSENGWDRMNPDGKWQKYDPKNVPANDRPAAEKNVQQANRDWQSRQTGEANHNAFRSAGGNQPATPAQHPSNVGGPGGFRGEPGGFRPSGGGGGRGGGRGGRR